MSSGLECILDHTFAERIFFLREVKQMVTVAEILQSDTVQVPSVSVPVAVAAAAAESSESVAMPADPSKDLENAVHALHREVHALRRQEERLVLTTYIVLAVIALVVLLSLAFCLQASRQLATATDVLARACARTSAEVRFA